MYKYNYFCFVVSLIGALIAFIMLKDMAFTAVSLMLTMLNYYLYYTGKQESEKNHS